MSGRPPVALGAGPPGSGGSARPGATLLGQPQADSDESIGGCVVLVGRDHEDLRWVGRFLGDDHERGRPVALDVELDPPKSFEWNAQRNAAAVGDDQASVADGHDRVHGSGVDDNFFVGLERVEDVGLEISFEGSHAITPQHGREAVEPGGSARIVLVSRGRLELPTN
jgi:hypothetical protein